MDWGWLLILSLGFELFSSDYLFVYFGIMQCFGSMNFLLDAKVPKTLIAIHLAAALVPVWLVFSHTAGYLVFGRDIGSIVSLLELSLVIFGPISQASVLMWAINQIRPNLLSPGYGAPTKWWILNLVMLGVLAWMML